MDRGDTSEFYVMWSKRKAVFFAPVYILLGLFSLLGIAMIVWTIPNHDQAPVYIFLLIVCLALMTLFAFFCIYFAFVVLRRAFKEQPLAIISRDGAELRHFFKNKTLKWSPETTYFYAGYGVMGVKNVPKNATKWQRIKELWWSPSGVALSNAFTKQSRAEIAAAVARLNPYHKD